MVPKVYTKCHTGLLRNGVFPAENGDPHAQYRLASFNAFEKIHSPESSKRTENSMSFELNRRLSLLGLVRGGSLSALYVQPSINSTHTIPPLVLKTNSAAVFGYSFSVYFWYSQGSTAQNLRTLKIILEKKFVALHLCFLLATEEGRSHQ
ncbi:hypothetical protein VULLAG_LOCUS17069 [Vulpes lagopus]